MARLRRELTDASVPDFDPCGGGVRARVLFLLEAPSGTGVGRGKEAKVKGSKGGALNELFSSLFSQDTIII